jgi:hypothetical protein
VKIPGTDEITDLASISKSGGLLNAFEATKLAASLNSTAPPKTTPKSTLKKGNKG